MYIYIYLYMCIYLTHSVGLRENQKKGKGCVMQTVTAGWLMVVVGSIIPRYDTAIMLYSVIFYGFQQHFCSEYDDTTCAA